MGKQPAIVIIARHGARIDAADKHWHLTSPTPYDPPLTYGGWTQCQALGARIGGILQSREESVEEQAENRRKRRRHKIVIHSSPFVRCVQTAVAISAGIGQTEKKAAPTSPPQSSAKPFFHTQNPRSPSGWSKAELEAGHVTSPPTLPPTSSHLPTKMKVDAFLGEWLSPDYFENMTPPPSSAMMVAGAKAELLRPAEEIKGADLSGMSAFRRSSAMSWMNDGHGSSDFSMASRSRANTFSNSAHLPPPIQEDPPAYITPFPTYAISNSDKIPIGFVSHARDGCVDVDYQWDSMREPLDWGDGGEFGEEWSSMHRRFRNGLQRMLMWYEAEYEDADGDEDLVLVLVTHGAGCNALIGAMTSAPVLLDVGMASLTLAVRKEQSESTGTSAISPVRSRRGSLDLGLSDQFEMKVIASTEHLRAPPNPLGLNSPRLGRSPAFASRRQAGADSLDGFSLGDPLSWRPSTSTGFGRSPSLRSHPAISVGPTSTTGLWNTTKTRLSRDETTDSSESDTLPRFERSKSQRPVGPTEVKQAERVNDVAPGKNAHIPVRTASQAGLWGSADLSNGRDENKTKRRWTLVDSS